MTRIAQMLTAYGQKHDRTDISVAREIGLNKSTFCRIKQGKMPDADNLSKIISWMIAEQPE
jgi:hypothetical protein